MNQQNNALRYKRSNWSVFFASSFLALRLLWYFHRPNPFLYLAALVVSALIFAGFDYILVRVGIDKPARAGLWISVTSGWYITIFIPEGLGIIKELILFAVSILMFGLAYIFDPWMTKLGKSKLNNENLSS